MKHWERRGMGYTGATIAEAAMECVRTDAELRAENQQLRADVAVLEEIAESVAEANGNALEMMLEVEQAHEEVHERNVKLREIIDNVQFGFFIIDEKMCISQEVTRSCSALFGKSKVAEEQLDKILGLSEDEAELFAMAVDEVFCDIMPEELTCEQIPSKFTVNQRLISMSARALRGESGDVHGILFSVIDVTDLEGEKRQNSRNKILLRILHDKGPFLGFVIELRDGLADARSALAVGRQKVARRIVHTIKGNCGIFGLDEVVSTAHQVEESGEILDTGISAIEAGVRQFLEQTQPVLGVDWEEETPRVVQLSTGRIDRLEELIQNGELEAAKEWIRVARLVRADSIWGPVDFLVRQVSKSYGKDVRFSVTGGELMISRGIYGEVLSSLHHILRNAVIHGIEDVGGRGDKPASAHLRLALGRDPDGGGLLLEIEDDGRGINTQIIANKLVEAGIKTAEEIAEMSEEERLYLILFDGFSSLDEADEQAGRGIGLAAVNAFIQDAGGHLEIQSKPAKGTLFRLHFPAE